MGRLIAIGIYVGNNRLIGATTELSTYVQELIASLDKTPSDFTASQLKEIIANPYVIYDILQVENQGDIVTDNSGLYLLDVDGNYIVIDDD